MTGFRLGRFRVVVPVGIWLFVAGIVFSLLGTIWFLFRREPQLADLGLNMAAGGSLLLILFRDRISIERGRGP